MRAPARPIATPPSARPRSNDAPESKPHLARWQLRRPEPGASRRRAPGRVKGRALLGGILSPMRGRAERWASARRRVCRLRACPARRATPCLARRRAPFTADGAVLPSIRIAACVEAASAPSAAPGGRRQPAMARAPGGARRGGLRGRTGLEGSRQGRAAGGARPGARGPILRQKRPVGTSSPTEGRRWAVCRTRASNARLRERVARARARARAPRFALAKSSPMPNRYKSPALKRRNRTTYSAPRLAPKHGRRSAHPPTPPPPRIFGPRRSFFPRFCPRPPSSRCWADSVKRANQTHG